MSSGKNVFCLEMAFELNMINHGQTMVMPTTLLELHVLTKVLLIKKAKRRLKKRHNQNNQ